MTLITDYTPFQNFCIPLLHSEKPLAVAIDMEFIRQTTYWPKLCLIQMATSLPALPATILIDPLAGLDLSLFQKILEAPHLTKIFHSARQDLEICWHEWQTLPVNFFDTQVAARACDMGNSIGYNSLVQKLLGITLEKDSQFTDWSRRPLTDRQVAYAQGDVAHLPAVYTHLQDKLTLLDRWGMMEDSLTMLLDPLTYQVDPRDAWKRLYSPRMKNANLAVLQDICAWRESTAMRLNVNRGSVLKDKTIRELSRNINI